MKKRKLEASFPTQENGGGLPHSITHHSLLPEVSSADTLHSILVQLRQLPPPEVLDSSLFPRDETDSDDDDIAEKDGALERYKGYHKRVNGKALGSPSFASSSKVGGECFAHDDEGKRVSKEVEQKGEEEKGAAEEGEGKSLMGPSNDKNRNSFLSNFSLYEQEGEKKKKSTSDCRLKVPSHRSGKARLDSFLVAQGSPAASRITSAFAAAKEKSELGAALSFFAEGIRSLFISGPDDGEAIPELWAAYISTHKELIPTYLYELQGLSTLLAFVWGQVASMDCRYSWAWNRQRNPDHTNDSWGGSDGKPQSPPSRSSSSRSSRSSTPNGIPRGDGNRRNEEGKGKKNKNEKDPPATSHRNHHGGPMEANKEKGTERRRKMEKVDGGSRAEEENLSCPHSLVSGALSKEVSSDKGTSAMPSAVSTSGVEGVHEQQELEGVVPSTVTDGSTNSPSVTPFSSDSVPTTSYREKEVFSSTSVAVGATTNMLTSTIRYSSLVGANASPPFTPTGIPCEMQVASSAGGAHRNPFPRYRTRTTSREGLKSGSSESLIEEKRSSSRRKSGAFVSGREDRCEHGSENYFTANSSVNTVLTFASPQFSSIQSEGATNTDENLIPLHAGSPSSRKTSLPFDPSSKSMTMVASSDPNAKGGDPRKGAIISTSPSYSAFFSRQQPSPMNQIQDRGGGDKDVKDDKGEAAAPQEDVSHPVESPPGMSINSNQNRGKREEENHLENSRKEGIKMGKGRALPAPVLPEHSQPASPGASNPSTALNPCSGTGVGTKYEDRAFPTSCSDLGPPRYPMVQNSITWVPNGGKVGNDGRKEGREKSRSLLPQVEEKNPHHQREVKKVGENGVQGESTLQGMRGAHGDTKAGNKVRAEQSTIPLRTSLNRPILTSSSSFASHAAAGSSQETFIPPNPNALPHSRQGDGKGVNLFSSPLQPHHSSALATSSFLASAALSSPLMIPTVYGTQVVVAGGGALPELKTSFAFSLSPCPPHLASSKRAADKKEGPEKKEDKEEEKKNKIKEKFGGGIPCECISPAKSVHSLMIISYRKSSTKGGKEESTIDPDINTSHPGGIGGDLSGENGEESSACEGLHKDRLPSRSAHDVGRDARSTAAEHLLRGRKCYRVPARTTGSERIQDDPTGTSPMMAATAGANSSSGLNATSPSAPHPIISIVKDKEERRDGKSKELCREGGRGRGGSRNRNGDRERGDPVPGTVQLLGKGICSTPRCTTHAFSLPPVETKRKEEGDQVSDVNAQKVSTFTLPPFVSSDLLQAATTAILEEMERQNSQQHKSIATAGPTPSGSAVGANPLKEVLQVLPVQPSSSRTGYTSSLCLPRKNPHEEEERKKRLEERYALLNKGEGVCPSYSPSLKGISAPLPDATAFRTLLKTLKNGRAAPAMSTTTAPSLTPTPFGPDLPYDAGTGERGGGIGQSSADKQQALSFHLTRGEVSSGLFSAVYAHLAAAATAANAVKITTAPTTTARKVLGNPLPLTLSPCSNTTVEEMMEHSHTENLKKKLKVSNITNFAAERDITDFFYGLEEDLETLFN